MCEIWKCCGVREERLLRKEGGGGGVLFESRPWYRKWKLGGVLSLQVDLQITSRDRLVVLYCINYATGADLTMSVKLWQIHVFQRQESSTL